MTCILTIEISDEFNIDRKCEEVVVGKMESNIGGTSAHLKKGEIYTI